MLRLWHKDLRISGCYYKSQRKGNGMKSQCAARWWFASICGLVAYTCALSPAADAPLLKYRFEAGKTYTYQVKIEAQKPEYTETITGESIYSIKLVDAKSGHMTL